MGEQVTPYELATENALICEKLLGWKRCAECVGFIDTDGDHQFDPQFNGWAEAGLILDALASSGANPTLDYREGKWDCYGGDPFENFFHAYADTGPLAIRAAALEHIRVMKL